MELNRVSVYIGRPRLRTSTRITGFMILSKDTGSPRVCVAAASRRLFLKVLLLKRHGRYTVVKVIK